MNTSFFLSNICDCFTGTVQYGPTLSNGGRREANGKNSIQCERNA